MSESWQTKAGRTTEQIYSGYQNDRDLQLTYTVQAIKNWTPNLVVM